MSKVELLARWACTVQGLDPDEMIQIAPPTFQREVRTEPRLRIDWQPRWQAYEAAARDFLSAL